MKPKHIISFLASLMIVTACQDKKKEEADKPGHFNKSLKVYGNMESSPVKLFVRGETN